MASHATEPRFRRVLITGAAFAAALIGYLVFNGLQVHSLTDARNSERSQKHSAEATISAQATVASKGVNLAGQLEGLCRTDSQFRAEHTGFCTQASQLATAQITPVPGPAGVSGAVGPSGPQGLPGVRGAAGPLGPQGPPGPQGLQGPSGATVTGPAGETGGQGPPGETVTGPVGAQGPQGDTGASGASGQPGADPSDIDFQFTVPGNPPLGSDSTYAVHCPWNTNTKKYDACTVTQQ